MMNKNDVLRRAKQLFPLAKEHAEHGEYCPFCAIALAKTKLDEEQGLGISISEALRQIAGSVIFVNESDSPLLEAKEALEGVVEFPYIQEQILRSFDLLIKARIH